MNIFFTSRFVGGPKDGQRIAINAENDKIIMPIGERHRPGYTEVDFRQLFRFGCGAVEPMVQECAVYQRDAGGVFRFVCMVDYPS